MREIKFRAKRTDSLNNEWIYGSYMDSYFSSRFGLVTAIFFNDYEICKTFRIPVLKDTVGQFTGLKDKNGKEIYEGDIIHIPENWEEYGWASGENYSIDFKDGRFRLRPKYKPNANGYDLEYTEELEVIGNIYENPELLKGADNIE